MTNREAKKIITAIAECLKCEDCNVTNCNECKVHYAQGTIIEQIESLQLAISAINVVMQLPERLSDDDIETIRIHLSTIKEQFCKKGRFVEAEDYQRLIYRFIKFAKDKDILSTVYGVCHK